MAEAQYNLGVMYAKGRGVPQDDVEAVKWWRLAAEQGDADAQLQIEIMEERGGLPVSGGSTSPIKPKAIKSIRIGSDGKPITE